MNHAPTHQDHFALAGLFVVADDARCGAGRDVVVGSVENEAVAIATEVEGLSDLLFVGFAIVAARTWCTYCFAGRTRWLASTASPCFVRSAARA